MKRPLKCGTFFPLCFVYRLNFFFFILLKKLYSFVPFICNNKIFFDGHTRGKAGRKMFTWILIKLLIFSCRLFWDNWFAKITKQSIPFFIIFQSSLNRFSKFVYYFWSKMVKKHQKGKAKRKNDQKDKQRDKTRDRFVL